MFIEIRGIHENEELVEEYVLSMAKRLGLAKRKTGEIIITFRDRMPKGYKGTLGLCEGDRNLAEILIAKKQTFYEQMRTLAHEMVHAKQFMKGEYPSEREAQRAEDVLFGRCYPWEKV